jgi:hypothetical protein
MKAALISFVLVVCFILGVFIASCYKELVGFTGPFGYAIAVVGGLMAVVSGVIILVQHFKHPV